MNLFSKRKCRSPISPTRSASSHGENGSRHALAASVLVTASVVGGGWAYLAQQRTSRLMATTRVVTDALSEAERFRGQAQSAALGDLTKWSEAMAAARHAGVAGSVCVLPEGDTEVIRPVPMPVHTRRAAAKAPLS